MGSKVKASVLIGGGIAAGLVMAWQILQGLQDGHLPSKLPLLIGLMILAVGLIASGISALFPPGAEESGGHGGSADYRHTYPLFATILGALALALVVRQFLIPATFGQDGHYRAAAAAEEAERAPRHLGKQTCVTCHEDIGDKHTKNVHVGVSCESCHGPGLAHSEAGEADKIKKPQGQFCLRCHAQMPGRPADFPQVKLEDHFEAVGAEKDQACATCHNPHEPAFWKLAPATP